MIELARACSAALVLLTALLAPGLAPTVAAAGPRVPAAAAAGVSTGSAPGAAPVQLVVSLQSVAPAVASPAADTTVSVTITSAASTPITGVTVQAVLGTKRFSERGAISQWLGASPTVPAAGRVVATAPQPATQPAPGSTPASSPGSTSGSTPAAAGLTIAPKASTTLSLTIPHGQLDSGRPFAALPLTIETLVAGTPRAGQRTILPWVARDQQYEKLDLSMVLPVTLPATPTLFTGTTAEQAKAWTSAIGPDSELVQRLGATTGHAVTWMVDPAVLGGPQTAGYRARQDASSSPTTTPTLPTPTGTTTPGAAASPAATPNPATSPGTGAATASPPAPAPTNAAPDPNLTEIQGLTDALAERLKNRGSQHPVWALPTADPDVAALATHRPSTALATQLFATDPSPLDSALGTSVDRGVTWPADGWWSAERAEDLRAASGGYPSHDTLVSTDSLAPANGLTAQAVASTAGNRLLAYDANLSAIASGSRGRSGQALVQEFLGESLVLLGQREGTRRTVLVAFDRAMRTDPATLGQLLTAVSTTPWLTVGSTQPLLTASAPQTPLASTPPAGSDPALLTGDAVADLDRAQQTVHGMAEVLSRSNPAYAPTWTNVVTQLASTRWRGHPGAWDATRSALSRSLTALRDGVQVAPSTINFLTDRGAIQLTIVNRLPYTLSGIDVLLETSSAKLRVEDPPSVTVAGNSQATVTVNVEAYGSGTVPVVARLATPSGAPLGQPATVSMNVRPTGVGVFVGIAAVLALVVVLGLIRSVRRQPTRAERDLGYHPATEPGPATSAPPSPAPSTGPRPDPSTDAAAKDPHV